MREERKRPFCVCVSAVGEGGLSVGMEDGMRWKAAYRLDRLGGL